MGRSKTQATATVATIKHYARLASAVGVEVEPLLARYEVDASRLDDPDGRVPYSLVLDFIGEVLARTDDDTWGLKLGALGRWGFVAEYLARNSPTLGEAFERIADYARLVVDTAHLELIHRDKSVLLRGSLPVEHMPNLSERVVRQGIDVWLAMLVSFGRMITGMDWEPIRVAFTYRKPDDTEAPDQFFRCPLAYEQPHNQIEIAPEVLELEVASADSELARILERHCDELLEKLPAGEGIIERVRRQIAGAVAGGETAIGQVAKELGLSSRTLQRHLAEEGTSYQALLDATRRQLSIAYLAERTLSVGEVALLLGYSDTRAFARAFKRWEGRTPSEYRRVVN